MENGDEKKIRRNEVRGGECMWRESHKSVLSLRRGVRRKGAAE